MSTPQTSIYMCAGVPLNNRYDHTFYFPTKADQQSYFAGKVAKTYAKYSYVRRSWTLKVEATMEEARVWSYLYFHTGNGKFYYYFINSVEYINDATVELSLELDVIQTYMFDWYLNPCYVEREHSATDAFGENTVDEGLDVGELITAKKETFDLSSDLVIMMAASMDINKYYVEGSQAAAGSAEDKAAAEGARIVGAKYDNVFGAFQVTATPLSTGWDDLAITLNFLNTRGFIESVYTMWEYPAKLITTDNGNYENAPHPYVKASKMESFTATGRPTSIAGYTPKNKKVLQYPYCFLYASNNAGGAAVYHYEMFDGRPSFRIDGNIAPDAVVKLTPVEYKGVTGENYDEALNMGNFPLCSWNNDPYKLWLAQNQNQNNLGMAMAGLKIAGGIITTAGSLAGAVGTGGLSAAGAGVGVGMISSGAASIAQQLAQRADKDIQPPQAHGSYGGSHNIARGIQNFDFYHKTVDRYHAEMIDNYFTMYGYACRKVKRPSIHNRGGWTYVKTVGSNVTGDFAMDDVAAINNIFDKGITFWATPSIGDYSLINSPIGG